MRVTGATRVAAVIGDPVAHSLSPTIHNAAFEAVDLDWVYVAAVVPAGGGADALAAAARLGLVGLSVTMPLKEEVALAADERAPTVARLGAANCVVRDGSSWVAHNTDGDGLVDDLRRSHDFDPAGRTAVVLGAGGAARAVVDALVSAGCSVGVSARRAEAAQGAVDLVAAGRSGGGGSAHVAEPEEIGSASLVVNATPLGMAGSPGLPCDPSGVARDALAVDLVYHPLESEWVRTLRQRGVEAHNGVGMLVGQAARQFELWTARPAPVDVMWGAVADRLAASG